MVRLNHIAIDFRFFFLVFSSDIGIFWFDDNKRCSKCLQTYSLLEPLFVSSRSWRSFLINPTKIVLDSLLLIWATYRIFIQNEMNEKKKFNHIVQIFTFNWPINNEQSNLLNKTIKFVYIYKIYSLLLFILRFLKKKIHFCFFVFFQIFLTVFANYNHHGVYWLMLALNGYCSSFFFVAIERSICSLCWFSFIICFFSLFLWTKTDFCWTLKKIW